MRGRRPEPFVPEVGAVYDRFNHCAGGLVPLSPVLVLSVRGRSVEYLQLAHGTVRRATLDGCFQTIVASTISWKRRFASHDSLVES